MFVSRTGSTLNAIFGMNEQGKPEATSMSDPQGVTLSDAQKLAVKNSKFFEAGASMSLLDQPGKMGHVFDPMPTLVLRCYARSVCPYCPEGCEQEGNYLNAHKETLVPLQAQHPDLDLSIRVHDVEFHGSPEMIENWRLI
ncbi:MULTISPECIES: hypothetical protein [unclassified Enterobacter]|uniref:hypothetical protein n=1 Tax=unclassified Enterobacter TaxID=2608935 RepID=UPI001CC05D7E|nr:MULTISPECIES: hypothetical protein [unclassified Enterobacter]UXP26110.1 hypothetical protein N8O08_11240 [Enterobacter sp. 155105]